MIAIIGWIVLGAAVGAVAARLSPEAFPGGRAGGSVAGAAGAFLGCGLLTLVADRGVARFDLRSLAVAIIAAAMLLAAIRKAQHAEPGPR